MKKFLLCALALIILLAAGGLFISRTKPGLDGPSGTDAAAITRGEYVARLADCAACHTAIDGKLYAGGLRIESPVGAIFSTNITPDKASGIGDYSLADFDRAVRQGVRKDGSTLYPAMPYPSFSRISDQDIRSLYAYFMHGVTPVARTNQAEQIHWPLSIRWPLAIWRGLFASSSKVTLSQPNAPTGATVARGRYLVTGPGHCGACHTPRGPAMQEKALDEHDGDSFLSGGTVIDGWYVPSLRGENATGLGRWSEDDIAAFLKTGRIDHAAVFGGMADVVAWSTQYFSDDDLRAMAKYLKTLPPAEGAPANYVYDGSAAELLDQGKTTGNRGAAIYLQQCSICHRNDGGGIPRMFPPLAGNPIVVSSDPVSVVHLVLQGGALPPSNWAPSTVAMPGYADSLSDQDIADVTNFVRGAWGNRGGTKVTATSVGRVRQGQDQAAGGQALGWQVMEPQPYGAGWTFSPQTHQGQDAAR